MQEMFKPVLTNLYNSGYDFFPLDSDRWGDLDQLVVLHSGYPAESGPNACTGNPPQNRIWSQGTAVTANGWQSPDLSFTVSTYMLGSAFTGGLCNGVPQKHGLIVHGEVTQPKSKLHLTRYQNTLMALGPSIYMIKIEVSAGSVFGLVSMSHSSFQMKIQLNWAGLRNSV